MCIVEYHQEQWLSKAAMEDAQAEKDPKHIYSVMEELGLRRQIIPGTLQALKLGLQDSRNQEQLVKIMSCFILLN